MKHSFADVASASAGWIQGGSRGNGSTIRRENMLSDFEAYLLLQMRGTGCIETLLAKERMTHDELARKADQAGKNGVASFFWN